MLKLIIAAAGLCLIAARAQASELSGPQISDLVAGATIEIDTPLGTRLPIRYSRDGKLSGQAGDLAWYLGAAHDHGRWWVASDQLCHRWSRWFDSVPQCLRLRKEGRIIRWRKYDGNTGIARISVPAPVQTAAVAPPEQPKRPKASAPPEVPPAPSGAAKPPSEPAAVALEPAAGAPEPEPPAVEEAAVPPPAPEQAPAVAEASPLPASQQTEPKSAAQPLFRVANIRGDDVLNVRSGPSADFGIVGGLEPGSRGIAITSACRSKWCPVQHRATSGWVNSAYLAPESPSAPSSTVRDGPDPLRACLTPAARALLDRIEQTFGPVQVVSTCRPGATVPDMWRASRHAGGNAVDFTAGSRKAAIVAWLIANHRSGGTMTYPGMDHIHVDIGPRFVSIASRPEWSGGRAYYGLSEAERR
jgi:SH3-like domain-containing protein